MSITLIQSKTSIKRTDSYLHLIILENKINPTRWFYIQIPKIKQPLFNHLLLNPPETYDLSDYGHILASGFGASPPDSVRWEIEETYTHFN